MLVVVILLLFVRFRSKNREIQDALKDTSNGYGIIIIIIQKKPKLKSAPMDENKENDIERQRRQLLRAVILVLSLSSLSAFMSGVVLLCITDDYHLYTLGAGIAAGGGVVMLALVACRKRWSVA